MLPSPLSKRKASAALGLPPLAETDPVIAMCERWRELDRMVTAAYEHAGQRGEELKKIGLLWETDYDGDAEYAARWAEYDRLCGILGPLGREIRAMPTRSLAGILAKLECWALESDPGPEDNTDHGLAVSALRDARHLCDPAAVIVSTAA